MISELSDLSYRSIGGKRQAPRSLKEGIVNIGTMPFELTPPPNAITKEMIMEYQKNKDKPYEVIDPITGNKTEYKYKPSTFVFDATRFQIPVYQPDATLGRPATQADIEPLKQQLQKEMEDLETEKAKLKRIKFKITELENQINYGRLRTNTLRKARADLVIEQRLEQQSNII